MQTLEIIGAVIGLIYLYLEYKANRWLWLFGVIMPVVYIVIFCKYLGMDGLDKEEEEFSEKREDLPYSHPFHCTVNVGGYCYFCTYSLYPGQLHRQPGTVWRCIHYSPEHNCHVDVGFQIHRTVGIVVCGEQYFLRALLLERSLLYQWIVCRLCRYFHFWIPRMEADDETRNGVFKLKVTFAVLIFLGCCPKVLFERF